MYFSFLCIIMRNRWKHIVTVLDKQIKQCNSLQNHPERPMPLTPLTLTPLPINYRSGVTLTKLKQPMQ